MITVSNVSLTFGGQKLFSGADLKFMPGNCYGVIGANGAGKSTFLRILSGELEPTTGTVTIPAGQRLSTLKQDQFKYDAYPVLDTVIMGNQRLYDIMKEKDELYAKPDFSDADGERAAELEGEFAEMDGWNAESDAATLLTGLGLPVEMHTMLMGDLKGGEKFKVLLAQALFGNPDILLLDEPTNNLDNRSVAWLEDFLMNFPGTLIVVSHDRWFLNNICTHIVDIDFNQVKLYVGNYDFWYESSKMMQSLMNDQKKRREDKIKELQAFIQRFSSNKSKAKQATSRRKLLDQLTIEQMPASSRRYPWVCFTPEREAGKDILQVTNLNYTQDGVQLLTLVEQEKPQLVFLDVEMPGKTGVECARVIQDMNPAIVLIFATAHDEYMGDAFEVYAFDYLLKPFKKERVMQTLERAKKRIRHQTDGETPLPVHPTPHQVSGRLMLHHKDGVSFLNVSDIVLVQREDRTTVFYTASGERYVTSDSLSDTEARLDSSIFFRCHKSYIINLNHIKNITPYGRWTYIVHLQGTEQDALITHEKYEELEKMFS